MIARLAKWHNRKKRTIHDRNANALKVFCHLTENNLAKLVFDADRTVCGRTIHLCKQLIRGGVGGIQQISRLISLAVRQNNTNPPHFLRNPTNSRAANHRHPIPMSTQLLQEVISQDDRIICIFLCQKSTVTHTILKVSSRIHRLTEDAGIITELLKLYSVCP